MIASRIKALIMIMGSILCWSISPIIIRYVKNYYPVFFLIFLRYLASLIVLWPFFIFSNRREMTRKHIKLLPSVIPKLLLIACVSYSFQVTYSYAFYLIYPGFATLIFQSLIIFSVFIAVILFPDERKTLKNWKFQAGLIIALSGVILIILCGKDLGKVEFSIGVLLILISAASWALLGSFIKKWLPGVSPYFALSTVCTIVIPLFLITYVVICGGFKIPKAPIEAWVLLIISGLVGVGLGQSLYYRAVPVLGITLSSSIGLLLPLFTGIISFFVFGEVISIAQVAGGVILISGSCIVIRIRFQHIL